MTDTHTQLRGGSVGSSLHRELVVTVPFQVVSDITSGVRPLDAGILYGTTEWGGTGVACGVPGCGTVVEYTLSSGLEVVRYSFKGAPGDGANPFGGVIFDPLVSGGLLYGTTMNAGTFGFGIAYSE